MPPSSSPSSFLAGRVFHLVITCNAQGALAARTRGLPNAQGAPDARRRARSRLRDDVELQRDAARRRRWPSGSWATARRGVSPPRPQTCCRRRRALAARLVARGFERVVYLGSNELRGLASEAALKLLELTDGRVVAVSDSTLGFRHGPKTIINDRTLVVVLLSNDALRARL